MLKTFSLPYGLDNVEFQAASTAAYKTLNIAAEIDLKKQLMKALENPIESLPLQQLAQGRKSVVIVCDDNTRPTPAQLILPAVLEGLALAGVNRDAITILMAGGTHRPMTEEEMVAKVGEEVFQTIRVVNHDFINQEQLVFLGRSENETPIWINKLVFDADLVLGIGSIVPHRYCGWAGGGKIIQPGVCGEETTIATHMMITKDESIVLGNNENPVRAEIDRIAVQAGLSFIINLVLDSRQRVVGLVAGHPIKAHRHGVQIAEKVYGVSLKRADIVIISSFPGDLNFWQAGKALYTADLAVKTGGTIILITPALEGPGEHPEFLTLIAKSYAEIVALVEGGAVEDPIGAAGSLAVALVKQRAEIKIVTDGLTDKEVQSMGFERFPLKQLQTVITDTSAKYPRPTINIIKEGGVLLPLAD